MLEIVKEGSLYETNGHTKRLLVVEDHAVFCGALAQSLARRVKLECLQAGSSTEGRERASQGVSAALVDLDLPDGGGTAVIRALRESNPQAPILALTMSRDQARSVAALQAGADEVLDASSSLEELIDAMARLVAV
jgi:DNA-binding NarL/FixJ family response regulator